MQNQRSTKEIETPGGHKVVIYDYMTGGENRKLQAVYMEGLTAQDINGTQIAEIMRKVPVATVFKAQEFALEMLIVSVNGVSENAYKLALDLKEEDLSAIFTEIDKYTTESSTKKKE